MDGDVYVEGREFHVTITQTPGEGYHYILAEWTPPEGNHYGDWKEVTPDPARYYPSCWAAYLAAVQGIRLLVEREAKHGR